MVITKKNKAVLDAIRQSKGRFFSLTTNAGECFNAQLVNETPNYIVVFDRNNYADRKVAKSNLRKVAYGSTLVG